VEELRMQFYVFLDKANNRTRRARVQLVDGCECQSFFMSHKLCPTHHCKFAMFNKPTLLFTDNMKTQTTYRYF